MEKIPPLVLLFHSFPEAVLLGLAGLVLVGVKPKFEKAIYYGILQTVVAYFIRQLNVPLGTHTLLLIPCVTFFLSRLNEIRIKKALVAALLGLILVTFAEGFFVSLVLNHTTLTLESIMAPENALLRVLVATPQMLFLGMVAFASYRLRRFHLTEYRVSRGLKYGRY